MKNKRKILASIILIGILVIVGYFVWSKKTNNLNTIQPTPTQVDTSNWKTYTDTQNGFEFKYPPTFFLSEQSKAIVLNHIENNQLDAITVFTPSANNTKSFQEYIAKYPIANQETNKPIQFKTRMIGSNIFYYAETERFEGALSYDYNIFHGNNVYRFISVGYGVDWTNPNLDVENEPTYVTLRNILSTLKFKK